MLPSVPSIMTSHGDVKSRRFSPEKSVMKRLPFRLTACSERWESLWQAPAASSTFEGNEKVYSQVGDSG